MTPNKEKIENLVISIEQKKDEIERNFRELQDLEQEKTELETKEDILDGYASQYKKFYNDKLLDLEDSYWKYEYPRGFYLIHVNKFNDRDGMINQTILDKFKNELMQSREELNPRTIETLIKDNPPYFLKSIDMTMFLRKLDGGLEFKINNKENYSLFAIESDDDYKRITKDEFVTLCKQAVNSIMTEF